MVWVYMTPLLNRLCYSTSGEISHVCPYGGSNLRGRIVSPILTEASLLIRRTQMTCTSQMYIYNPPAMGILPKSILGALIAVH